MSLLLVPHLRAEMREWQSDLGHTVQAEWLGRLGGFHWLVREDGEILRALDADLVEQDQVFLKELEAVAEANRAAGMAVSSWSAPEADEASMRAMRLLVDTTVQIDAEQFETLGDFVRELQKRVRASVDPPGRITFALADGVSADRKVRVHLPKLRAYKVVELLTRSTQTVYRFDNGILVIENRY